MGAVSTTTKSHGTKWPRNCPCPHAHRNRACRLGDGGVNDEGRINRRRHQSENRGSKTKKGYEVKRDGSVIRYVSKNTK